MMQSLAREAQPYHPLHLSRKAATKLRYKLSILQALQEDGLIEEILDRRDGSPIKITKKGKQALEAWYVFANAINGEAA